MVDQFLIDGKPYNVHVVSLTRSFVVRDAVTMGYTQNGGTYRDPVGTYFNYSMTVMEKDSDRVSFDALFDLISRPDKSHVCTFPYNQSTLTQEMFITQGRQPLKRIYSDGIWWDALTIDFVAVRPKVVP